MGGGGAMRAAAKVAGVGAFVRGLRGTVPDNPVSAAARRIARPVTGFVSSSDNVKGASVAIDASPAHKPCWEIDDWELAGAEGVLAVSSGSPTPRLVFGGAPSLEEAKEATYELKDVLEKAYLSVPPKSEVLETKDCVTSETIVTSAAPNHAIQAFRFLNESPAVQTVVASIASDPNVWNAVLLNPTLQDYLQSQKISTPFSSADQHEKVSMADVDILFPSSPRRVPSNYAGSASEESNHRKGFMGLCQELKLKVVDMVNSLSGYFWTMFKGESGEKERADANGNISSSFEDKALGASLMGVAVMVIMVVVLKRA